MTQKSILFSRHFDRYSGGHQKVFDYFSHVNLSESHRSFISFTDDSLWNQTNPWHPRYRDTNTPYLPSNYDQAFLAGTDWQRYLRSGNSREQPVVNLIQHVRHGDSGSDVFPFLEEKAIRVCVSQAVEEAILNTGRVNGPTLTIPNGIEIPIIANTKSIDIYIAGLKNPLFAKTLSRLLNDKQVLCQTEPLPHPVFLDNLSRAKICVLLPHRTEGFFLPALESMALADLTIVPDCVGNTGFCHDISLKPAIGNCLMPEYSVDSILLAIAHAEKILLDSPKRQQIYRNAANTIARHTLDNERTKFQQLLLDIDELWSF